MIETGRKEDRRAGKQVERDKRGGDGTEKVGREGGNKREERQEVRKRGRGREPRREIREGGRKAGILQMTRRQ